ncbi:hypothetical protein QJS10_CPA07g00642 [Acorus calamus]|uniref:Uncharacterized protein n=1 Tax=Acorus calamus TaxID=4465 RepID=A0AAV9EFJ3_ACOCL|nr:hypothetical protein QJS10_CPA07g00642 [Acorus calamus]
MEPDIEPIAQHRILALAERQGEQEAATREMQNEEGHNMMPSIISNRVSAAPSDRRVGLKSKREDDGDDDIEWEEALPSSMPVTEDKRLHKSLSNVHSTIK